MNSTPERPRDEAPSDFLRSLVDAMRRVVEATRDQTLAEMRDTVETEAGQLDAARSTRETALRERAEAEIVAIGTWERAEIERIRADALRKVQARGGQLDQELAELTASTNAEHAALAARADAYERDVSSFIEGLDGIDDPTAFAAAARRMPAASTASKAQPQPATTSPSPEPEPATTWASTAPRPATAPQHLESEPTQPEAEPAMQLPGSADGGTLGQLNGDTAAAEAEAAAEATSIQVRGLSSFGAITSFKQSLERVDGIHSVTLGLGPSGEFVYTATHAPAFDLDAAIRAIEGGAEIARDGATLRVKVGRKAG